MTHRLPNAVSRTELGYLDGVTSAIQTQVDAKLPLTGGTMTGTLVAATPSTSLASINLPHGIAPTTPTNGDVWTTTSGMYARINGVTVGPYAAAAGGAVWGTITGTLSSQTDLQSALAAKAPLASPTFTGTVTLPTLVGSDVTDSSSSTTGAFKTAGGMGIAKKLYVGTDLNVAGAAAITGTVSASGLAGSLLSSANPLMNNTVSVGTSAIPSRQDHVHPVDTSRASTSQTFYIGTTSVAINRASASLDLAGVTLSAVQTNLKVPYSARYSSSGPTINNGAHAIVTVGSSYGSSGVTYSAGTFTVPSAGIYTVSGNINGPGAAGSCYADLYFNGAQDVSTLVVGSISGFGWWQSISWTGYMAASDTVAVYASQTSGANRTISNSNISVVKVADV